MNNTTLLQNVKLFDPSSDLHNQTVEILVKNGLIDSVGEGLGMAAAEVIDCGGAYVSAGWLDAFGFCPDPGSLGKRVCSLIQKRPKWVGLLRWLPCAVHRQNLTMNR